jgi:hypothetical protein
MVNTKNKKRGSLHSADTALRVLKYPNRTKCPAVNAECRLPLFVQNVTLYLSYIINK